MSRPKAPKNGGLPDNLTARRKSGRVYYSYRNPRTGKETGMGTDRTKAVDAAKTLNAILAKGGTLVARVMTGGQTFGGYLTHWEEQILPAKRVNGLPLSPETVAEYTRILKVIDKALGLIPLAAITQADIARYLNGLASAEVYNKHRALLVQICRNAVSDGRLQRNLAEAVVKRDRDRKQRGRLTLEAYSAIYAKAKPVIQHGMELALNILQRNYDLRMIRFTDLQADGYLYLVQSKTRKHGKSAYLQIPDTLRTVHSEAGHRTLKDLVRACRDDIPCPFILHEIPDRKRKSLEKEHWAQLGKKRLSRGFAEARDATGLFDEIPEAERPTFYECVSLGMHLREKSGWTKKQVRALKGHTSDRMTDHYLDGHDYTTIEDV